MRKMRFCALALCGALAGCGSSGATVHLHAGSAQMSAFVSPAVAGETNAVAIYSDTVPVSAVMLDMPGMQMPPKRYVVTPRGSHYYEASDITLSMAGTWRVRLLNTNGAQIAVFAVAIK